MKNLKLLILSLSFVMYNGALFSQIKSGKNVLKTDKISKTDIKLRSFNIKNQALKVDNIDSLSVEEISGLSIPRITPISPEVIIDFNTKTTWEVEVEHLNDGDLAFENMASGTFSFNDGFKLKPQVFFRKVIITYQEDISPSKLVFSFKQREGEMYLLEIPVTAYAGNSLTVLPQPYFTEDELNFVTIGRNGDYQTHQIVGGKVTTVWTAEYTGDVDFKIVQKIPETESKHAMLSCVTKIKSIKIRNITE